MAQYEVKLPDLGEGVEKATLSFWHFEEGNKVVKDNDLVEAVTDKATFNIPVPVTGILTKIFFKEGDEIKVNDVVAIINTE